MFTRMVVEMFNDTDDKIDYFNKIFIQTLNKMLLYGS